MTACLFAALSSPRPRVYKFAVCSPLLFRNSLHLGCWEALVSGLRTIGVETIAVCWWSRTTAICTSSCCPASVQYAASAANLHNNNRAYPSLVHNHRQSTHFVHVLQLVTCFSLPTSSTRAWMNCRPKSCRNNPIRLFQSYWMKVALCFRGVTLDVSKTMYSSFITLQKC